LGVVLGHIVDGHFFGGVESHCLFNSEVARFADIARVDEISKVLGVENVDISGSLV